MMGISPSEGEIKDWCILNDGLDYQTRVALIKKSDGKYTISTEELLVSQCETYSISVEEDRTNGPRPDKPLESGEYFVLDQTEKEENEVPFSICLVFTSKLLAEFFSPFYNLLLLVI